MAGHAFGRAGKAGVGMFFSNNSVGHAHIIIFASELGHVRA